MTDYKIGDSILVHMRIGHIDKSGKIHAFSNDLTMETEVINPDRIRPYTPRQEFEYGEEVEVKTEFDSHWLKAKFIGKSHHEEFFYAVNILSHTGVWPLQIFPCIRKLNTKKETITIGNTTYDKSEFEAAVKGLKPVEGK